ncbi:P-loop containing nucleoside triphosphate hydrolase protein [Geopyxis carbonaria]|nr:P-loop containing nucleoside triphosphate hydrolase protein [Geopyxis carbonaria]
MSNGTMSSLGLNGHESHTRKQPIFMATHPRACSTAFERVMMTREDLVCVHEPFGDAFYFGPERLGSRYNGNDAKAKKDREQSGFSHTRYSHVVNQIEKEEEESNKRVFIKDITHYLLPPSSLEGKVRIAPSLRLGLHKRKGYGTAEIVPNGDYSIATSTNGDTESNGNYSNGTQSNGSSVDNGHSNGNSNGHSNGDGTSEVSYPDYQSLDGISEEDIDNPTVMPLEMLRQYKFTFLIRHPRRSIPSYFRCTQPPLSDLTGFHNFLPEEAGYRELRVFFDYVRSKGLVDDANVFVLDADDLLDAPKIAIRKYCEAVDLDFSESMLEWGMGQGCEAFEKWKGFHEDAIKSSGLKARTHKKEPKTEEQEFEEWSSKWGEDAAKLISQTVKENVADYEYLRGFKVNLEE